MDIASLFVTLGIKTDSRSKDALKGTKDGLEGAAAAGEKADDGLKKTRKGVKDTGTESQRAGRKVKDAGKEIGGVGKSGKKTQESLKGTSQGLKQVASDSFAAKAALVGAFYAIERLFSASGKTGADLKNFGALVGVSAQELQRYQYAARQVNVSNEEVEASFKGLQSTMTKTLMGEGAPKGLARVAQLTGNITPADIDAWAKSPAKLIQRLQEYAAKETNAGFRNETIKSFGISDAMTSALARQAFKPDILAKAPVYSEGTVNALDKVNAAWANLSNQIEMGIGGLNAKHGGSIVSGVSKIITELMRLGDALLGVAEKLKVFEGIKLAVTGLTELTKGAASGVKYAGELIDDPKKREELKQNLKDFFATTTPGENNLVTYLHATAAAVNQVSAAFKQLGKEAWIFEKLGDIFESWATIFEGVTSLTETIIDAATSKEGQGAIGKISDALGKAAPVISKILDYTGVGMMQKLFTGEGIADIVSGANAAFGKDAPPEETKAQRRKRRNAERRKGLAPVPPQYPEPNTGGAQPGAAAGQGAPAAPQSDAPTSPGEWRMPSMLPGTEKQGAFLRLVPNMPDMNPRMPGTSTSTASSKQYNVTVQQTLEFHDAGDVNPQAVAAAVKKQVKDAWVQMSARTGGV